MAVKTTISDGKGVVESKGTGTTIKNAVTLTSAVTLDTLPKATLQAKTAAATLTEPGAYTVSGSAAFDLIMPLASAVPGGVFVLRTLSEHAHGLTGSAETSGTTVFCNRPDTAISGTNGSKIAVLNEVGASLTVISDGLNFCLLAASGTVTINGL